MTGFDLYVYGVVIFTVLVIIGKVITQPKREKTELEVKIHNTTYGWMVKFFKVLGLIVLIILALIMAFAVIYKVVV